MIILVIYMILHLPAIILVIIGVRKRTTNPVLSRNLFILAGIYFVVGAGICGSLFWSIL